MVVAARIAEKASALFAEAGLEEGYQTGADGSNGGILIVEDAVDVTNPATLTPHLFEGVTQVSMSECEDAWTVHTFGRG